MLDLWVQQWRKRVARGEVTIVRYADDFVMGFQQEVEAARFRVALQARLERFGLEVHPDKTRLLEFGRFAEQERRAPRGGQAGYVRLPSASRTFAGSRGPGTSCFSVARRRNECAPSCSGSARTSCGIGLA